MDIDIDLAPGVDPRQLFPMAIPASKVEDGVGELSKHPVGYYFQNIPVDKLTGLAAITFRDTEDYGYYKIDFLTLNILKHFKSKKEMRDLQRKEPNWDLLHDAAVVQTLFHIGKHFNVVNRVKPRSIMTLADVVALIRPKKISLLDKYLKNPDECRYELFTKTDNSDMRKAHAVPYALLIVLQLHLIEQGRL